MYDNVIVTGTVAYDEIMDFPKRFIDFFQPDKLHQINISFVVDKLEKQFGGTATNISYNLSLVTSKKIILLGAIGKDGYQLLKFLRQNKIDTGGLVVDTTLYTATGKVITDIKDNQIWGYYYGASEKAKEINLNRYAKKNSLVIISANHPKAFLNFMNQTIDLKADYMLDPGMVLTWISRNDLKKGVENCRWLVGNDYETSRVIKVLKTSISELLNRDIAVIITLGEKGVLYQDKRHKLEIPAFKLKKIVDPTGAGDAWRAGFIGGIIENKNIEFCLKQANALASFAVEHYGTVKHKPTKKEILDRIKSLC